MDMGSEQSNTEREPPCKNNGEIYSLPINYACYFARIRIIDRYVIFMKIVMPQDDRQDPLWQQDGRKDTEITFKASNPFVPLSDAPDLVESIELIPASRTWQTNLG